MNTEYVYIDPREAGRLRDEFAARLLAMLAALRAKNGSLWDEMVRAVRSLQTAGKVCKPSVKE